MEGKRGKISDITIYTDPSGSLKRKQLESCSGKEPVQGAPLPNSET